MAIGLAPSGQSSPRLAIANMLLSRGLQGNAQSLAGGAAQAGSAIIGALMAKEGLREQSENREAGRQALLSAFDTPGMAGSDPAQRMAIANLLTDPNVMSQPGAEPIISMLMEGIQPPDPTSQFQNFQFAQENPEFAEFLAKTSSAPSASVNIAPGALAPTRATTNTLQSDTLDAQAALLRMDDIAASFDPKFLEIPTQIGMSFNAFRDKLGSVGEIFGIPGLTLEQKQSLTDYTTFTSRTTGNLNLVLNQLSGVAVTPQEFERQKEALPSMDDSPTEFRAKMNNSIRDMRRALARLNIAQRRGLNPLDSGISLEGVDAIINQEAELLTQQLTAQGVPANQIQSLVDEELRRMFFGGPQ